MMWYFFHFVYLEWSILDKEVPSWWKISKTLCPEGSTNKMHSNIHNVVGTLEKMVSLNLTEVFSNITRILCDNWFGDFISTQPACLKCTLITTQMAIKNAENNILFIQQIYLFKMVLKWELFAIENRTWKCTKSMIPKLQSWGTRNHSLAPRASVVVLLESTQLNSCPLSFHSQGGLIHTSFLSRIVPVLC